ncbi:hypothetical protein AGMMS50276_05340 [Synergistales bacterium]|nr:hypothetical protein AGMMS50276_05340 [Synergistales bacterium]
MKTDSEIWAKYWDKEAMSFNRIYTDDAGVRGILNRIFRHDMEGRFRFALERANLELRPDILEIGCGGGAHTCAFLEAGAMSVTGIDLSSQMLSIAKERLKKINRYKDRAIFIEGDFMIGEFNRKFDVATIIGVFDYISNSQAFLKKALELAPLVIATFPMAGTLRALIRRVRLAMKGCPVYFYSRAAIDDMAEACGASVSEIEIIGQLYCAVFKK